VTSRVVVVSDSHFSDRTPEADRNWTAVLRHVESLRPDLVVHVGDVTVDGAHHPAELGLARQRLDEIPVPWRVVPGNHDVGDNPTIEAPDDDVTSGRVEEWHRVFGPDHWLAELDAWRLLGVDAQLFGSGTAEEDDQWTFLEDGLRDERRTVLVTHKPLTAGDDELATAPPYRFLPPPARARLTELCRAGGVELVLSGHVHQQRRLEAAGLCHHWVTTTWAVLPEWLQATVGAKRCGLLDLALPSDGAGPEAVFVEPPGMAQLTLGENVASPYESPAGEPAV
jgi:3',5'-cyclic AMP phosphodiesterase CpdA